MKTVLLFLTSTLIGTASAYACTNNTIETIAGGINPYYTDRVANQMATALDTLGLCDENLEYAGQLLGNSFNPYYTSSISGMAAQIVQRKYSIPADLNRGLGLSIIDKINLYYPSTYAMLNVVRELGRASPFHAKTFALQLLQKQNAYYTQNNNYLLSTVQDLRLIANPPPPPDAPPVTPPPPTPVPSSIWAFRSNSSGCENVTGPWGIYEMCPRYYASVSDQLGNRVVLACKAENYGIEFRVSLAQSNWARLARLNIQTLAFGTGSLVQSLGVPYVIPRDRALMAEEPVSSEILDLLRRSNSLIINVRANSGEANMRLNFTLKGSNVAIQQLLQNCR